MTDESEKPAVSSLPVFGRRTVLDWCLRLSPLALLTACGAPTIKPKGDSKDGKRLFDAYFADLYIVDGQASRENLKAAYKAGKIKPSTIQRNGYLPFSLGSGGSFYITIVLAINTKGKAYLFYSNQEDIGQYIGRQIYESTHLLPEDSTVYNVAIDNSQVLLALYFDRNDYTKLRYGLEELMRPTNRVIYGARADAGTTWARRESHKISDSASSEKLL